METNVKHTTSQVDVESISSRAVDALKQSCYTSQVDVESISSRAVQNDDG